MCQIYEVTTERKATLFTLDEETLCFYRRGYSNMAERRRLVPFFKEQLTGGFVFLSIGSTDASLFRLIFQKR